MAHIYPERLLAETLNDPRRTGEIKVFELFKTLSKEYRIYYSCNWITKKRNEAPKEGEADFVIVHPRKGILVLEVKGGLIQHDGNSDSWISVNRNNQPYPIKNPFKQAERNKYALRDKIESHPNYKNSLFKIGHAVIFPDSSTTLRTIGANAPSEIIIYKNELDQLESRIEQIFLYWQEPEPGMELVNLLHSIFAPSFELTNPLINVIQEDSKKILQLTEQQFNLLKQLRKNKRVKINGGAGSGKTILALEKAKRLADEGFSVLFTCYSKPLANYCAKSLNGIINLTVLCYEDLCLKIAKDFKIPTKTLDEIKDLKREERLDRLTSIYLKIVEDHSPELFDAIIVDEGQDFKEDWWFALELSLSNKKAGIFYLFFDNNQNVHQDKKYVPDNMMEFSLTENFRNTKPIYSLSKGFYSGEAMDCKGPEGVQVELILSASNQVSQSKVLETTLNRLIQEEKIKPEMIAILTGQKLKESPLFKLGNIGKYSFSSTQKDESGKVIFESIRRFKGLERSVIILVEIDEITKPGKLQLDMLYVGITRAQNHLIVIGEEKTTLKMFKSRMR